MTLAGPPTGEHPAKPSSGRAPWVIWRRSPLLVAGAGAVLAVGVLVAAMLWIVGQVQADRTGSLTLAAVPDGAAVSVDGKLAGRAPLTLTVHGVTQQHSVLVQAPGYQDWKDTITVSVGDAQTLDVQLKPQPATVTVTSQPDGAEVRLSGNVVGRTPLVLRDVAPGTYDLQLSLPTFRDATQQVQVQPGDAVVRALALQPAPARLEIVPSAPGGVVVLDGQARGPAPVTVDDVAAGKHSVRIEQDGTVLGEATVELAAGQQRRLEVPVRTLTQAQAPAWVDSLAPNEPAYPVAIMVENSEDARPQSGLHAAAIVYEALAEGGISRFMAVFVKGTSEVIGPVRSTRDYFVNLAKEFNAPLVHIGASPGGYQALSALGVTSLDETYGMPGFWRSRTRVAPHNAYVSTASVRDGLNQVTGRPQPGSLSGFVFKRSPTPTTGADARTLAIDYGWSYRVGYEYDPGSNTYARYMDRSPHIDAENGEQLRATNVVVMTVGATVIDDEGRLAMDQVGEGRLRVFEDGKVVEGRWRKTALGAPTQLLDGSGAPIALNPGQTWVQIVPTTATLTY